MTETPAQGFRAAVQHHLLRLEDDLVDALRKLITYTYPAEVVALQFEVFSDAFTVEFPARVFFVDSTNCEYFIEVDGKAEYPSPIDPGLLDVAGVYSSEIEDQFEAQDETLDLWGIACSEFITWFSACWDKAGGSTFPLLATICVHDDEDEFNLMSKTWQEQDADGSEDDDDDEW